MSYITYLSPAHASIISICLDSLWHLYMLPSFLVSTVPSNYLDMLCQSEFITHLWWFIYIWFLTFHFHPDSWIRTIFLDDSLIPHLNLRLFFVNFIPIQLFPTEYQFILFLNIGSTIFLLTWLIFMMHYWLLIDMYLIYMMLFYTCCFSLSNEVLSDTSSWVTLFLLTDIIYLILQTDITSGTTEHLFWNSSD